MGERETLAHEAGKARLFENTDPVKIEVTAVLLCRFGMKDVGRFKKQLLSCNLPGQRFGIRTSLLSQTCAEPSSQLCRSDMFYRKQVLTDADGIADAQATFGFKGHDGMLLRNPIGSGIEPS